MVEDEEKIARLLASRLELVGYEVHTEAYGKRALNDAVACRPDLVILDLRLPDMDGYEVCQQLRSFYHAWVVPVLMLTALDTPLDQLRGYTAGANAYLTKPFELPEVLETVALLLGEAAVA